MSHLPLRIVGHGLAGSVLAWECECADIPFRILDPAGSPSASDVAAGILNPITGQRVVKSWRVDELLPIAVNAYRKIEDTLGETFLHPLRVRRFYRDEREREVARAKLARGELAPYVSALDDEGFWIDSAFRLDSRKLVEHLRLRWKAQGRLNSGRDVAGWGEDEPGQLTIWCCGAGELARSTFSFARLQAAKGQILSIASGAIESGVVLNDGHWLLPTEPGQARVGATFERGDTSLSPTADARATLAAAAKRLLQAEFEITGHDVGVRVTTPDKRPVIGRHPQNRCCGIVNGLGSKGGMLAPWLARQWVAQVERGAEFDPDIDVRRYGK